MKLIFEKSRSGRRLSVLPELDVPEFVPSHARKTPLQLPELSETDISRHYTELADHVYGVNNGFYPLGSCTMKYNPSVNEEMASLPAFTGAHPLAPTASIQGCLEVYYQAEQLLCGITGMNNMTFAPAAGAHGELTGLMMIKAYHQLRGDTGRTKIIVPDSAHGTNPASASMVGFTVVNIPSGDDGCVDLEMLRNAVGSDTAGLMLTNPNTLGLFDKNILEITKIVHAAGGLTYYDGANMNAVMGVARPGDMGFDIVHLNLHKTFSTPHGGGGPGACGVGVKSFLSSFLPRAHVIRTTGGFAFETPANTIGNVRAFYGNFLVVVRALCYIIMLGRDGLLDASLSAVLNANYLKQKLSKYCKIAYDHTCMHEFVVSLEDLKQQTGVSALDFAKGMIDGGVHPPTIYFPLIVHEALMFEPTETESVETLDDAADLVAALVEKASSDPSSLHSAPYNAYVSRPDEVTAARSPVLRYHFDQA